MNSSVRMIHSNRQHKNEIKDDPAIEKVTGSCSSAAEAGEPLNRRES